MKRNSLLTKIILFTLLFTWIAASTGFAQLVIIRKKVKVVKVDTTHDRIEITGVDDPMETLGYVEIDGDTKVHWGGKPYAWWKIKPGWIIGVKGGLGWTGHIHANDVEVLRTSP